jgi:opacity protein-like surface antigen
MLWRLLALRALVLVPLVVLAPSGAQADTEPGRTSFYVSAGVGVGLMIEDAFVWPYVPVSPSDPPFDFTEMTDSSILADFRGGWRFHEHWAVEGQLHYLPDFTTTSTFTGGMPTTRARQQVVDGSVNVRGYLLTGRVQPYALFGLGGMWAEDMVSGVSGAGFMIRAGGGFETWVFRNVGLDVAMTYQQPFGDVADGVNPNPTPFETLARHAYFSISTSLILRF